MTERISKVEEKFSIKSKKPLQQPRDKDRLKYIGQAMRKINNISLQGFIARIRRI